MACCSACAHFLPYTGTTRGACDYVTGPGETWSYSHTCGDGFDPRRKVPRVGTHEHSFDSELQPEEGR